MKIYFQFLLLLTVVANSIWGVWEDGNVGVDRPGADFPDSPITLNTGGPRACAKHCQMKANCKAWAFNAEFCSETNFTQPPLCYLKTAVTQQRLDPCKLMQIQQSTMKRKQPVSFLAIYSLLLIGIVQCDWNDGNVGVDRPGGNFPGMPVPLNTSDDNHVHACAELCQKTTGCVAWAFNQPFCSSSNSTQPPECYLKSSKTSQQLDPCRISGVITAGLKPPKFYPLPLGTIKPGGWIKQQLQLQANGLSGHLPLFWPDVENSSWIGGTADVGLHERAPYWLNGFVPLAYQLNDPDLISMAEKYIMYIISHQSEEGWLGEDDSKDGNRYWSKYYVMFVLRMYYEATGNETVFPVMYKFLHCAYKRMFSTPFGTSWSAARWQDLVLTLHWLLDNHPNGEEQFLWDMAELVQQQGFNWKGFYSDANFPKEPVTAATLFTHGVNNGQAIKSGGVWYRQSGNQSDWDSSYQRMEVLDKYHGQATGIFSCDEHLAGLLPSRGTELCTVVEAMYSYEVLFGIHGDPLFAERAEQIGYNALPATITSDMWAHQYLQQDNEINAMHLDDHIWTHDGPDSIIYGLAPNYGCCTANFNQGWPKLLQNAVMISPDNSTITFAILAPLTVTVGETTLTVETDYPFGDTVTITGSCSKEMKNVNIRVPSWAEGATLSWGSVPPTSVPAGKLFETSCNSVAVEMKLTIPFKTRVTRRFNNAASIYRGPLLYGLQLEEDFKVLKTYEFQSKDYQITTSSPWSYAIHLTNDSNPDEDLKFQNNGLLSGVPPFSIKGAPSKITATGRLVAWGLLHNAADAPPTSPVSTNNKDAPITLIPFGATDLRIAEIPTYN